MNANDIIIRPVLTEKSYSGIEGKRYTFVVNRNANKIQIKNAVEEIFGVTVDRVNTINVKGKLKRQGRSQGYTAKYKKAVVMLKEGSKTIEYFDSLSM